MTTHDPHTGAAGVDRPSHSDAAGPGPVGDPLASLDAILAEVAGRGRDAAARLASRLDTAERFRSAFTAACVSEVRPAMEAVIGRLRANGGGGVVEQHPGGEARFRNPSLVAWLSLEGEIVGEPRPDREPYLQLEADLVAQEVRVIEGDMWRGAGGNRSGRVGTWQVSELTRERVTAELLEIARRSAQ